MSQVARPDRVVVGVDFGTLSGRAVVVRVTDGEELGTRRPRLPARRARRGAPRRARRCPPTGRCRSPATTVDVLRIAVPAALARGRRRPRRRSSASPPTSPPARWCPTTEDGTPLCELPRLAAEPHAYVKLWRTTPPRRRPTGINELAAQALRGVAGPVRRPDLLGVGVRQGPPDARGGARRCTPRWRTSSRPPTGSCGSCAGRYTRNACTAGYKGIYQDGTYPSRDFLAELNPDFADFVADKLEPADRHSSATAAGGLSAEAAAWTGSARGHRRRRRQRRRARDRTRRPARSSPARWSRSWAPRPATS